MSKVPHMESQFFLWSNRDLRINAHASMQNAICVVSWVKNRDYYDEIWLS